MSGRLAALPAVRDMKRVAASEFELLTVARALFEAPRKRRPAILAGLLRQTRELPKGVGPTALALMRDTMAKGIVLALVGRGGWRRSDSLQLGDVVSGRLWERHTPPGLHVTPFAMDLCRWLTSEPLRSPNCAPLPTRPVTIADEFVLYLALDLTRRAGCAAGLRAQAAVRASALCWLGFADLLARAPGQSASFPPADISVYAFAPWTSGAGAVLLEALQWDLAQRWVRAERDKRRIAEPGELIAFGRIQDAVLRAYFGAIQGAARLDLSRFIITACCSLLAERSDSDAWQPALDGSGPLHLRSDARRASVALLRNLRTVRLWVEQAAGVRFFDEEYDAAQLLLRIWEPLGESGYQRALAVASAVESIDGLVGQ